MSTSLHSPPLRAVLIGCGEIGQMHAKALSRTSRVDLAGIVGRSEAATRPAAQRFGVEAFRSLEDALAAEPDYFIIATPHAHHVPCALRLIGEGFPVFIEKPLSVDLREAAALTAAVAASGLAVQVNYLMRLKSLRQKVCALVRDGEIGDPLRVSLVSTRWFRSDAYYQGNGERWRGTWAGEGGGILCNQAPHDLDFLCQILGKPKKVSATLHTQGHAIETEDTACAWMEWSSGCIGTALFTTCEAPGRFELEIAGTRGTLLLTESELKFTRLQQCSRSFSRTSRDFLALPPIASEERFSPTGEKNRMETMHENMAGVIRGEAAPVCPVASAGPVVELAAALLVSDVTGAVSSVPPPADLHREILGHLRATRSLCLARQEWKQEGAASQTISSNP